MKPRVEILAPAGSIESMKAAVNAGADAVYMGGSRFGARAYADNPEEDQFLEAIDYAHLHGCKLYMTVNTLVKEHELDQLYDFLKPYYEQGLDAVIVQDLGVFSYIRSCLADLPIHVSTQMTVTGWRSAQLLKEMGASRVVTARELSLEELRQIHDHVDIEIESFVHGALCYCYSGQCLLSSLIGGRSGNRGRCAQPCRLPYEVQGQTLPAGKRQKKGVDERYLLSLKDLCTLDILPNIIEAGVYSLKIEGRMKSPRYTAGVVSVYRKYVDLYLEQGRKGYRVDPADRQMLLDLFDRGGFTEGYYRQHNGGDMVALKEKPAFREGNQELFDRLDREYVHGMKQEPVWGFVTVHEGEPAMLCLSMGEAAVSVTGEVVQPAQNQPLTEDKLLRQMKKTGSTPFYFEALHVDLQGKCFLPVQALNELRRKGMEQLETAVTGAYRRVKKEEKPELLPVEAQGAGRQSKGQSGYAQVSEAASGGAWSPRLHISLENPACFAAVLSHPEADAIYLDSTGFGAESWKRAAEDCHAAGKQCALILPHIFRTEAELYLGSHSRELRDAGFDAFVLRSMEEIVFLRELGLGEVPMVFDANLYALNHLAEMLLRRLGAARLTLPLECNSRELKALDCSHGELIAYGYLPAMVSAQCILRTTDKCRKQPKLLYMKDRTGKQLPVKNHCRFCYNTIYNPSPLSLLGQESLAERLAPAVLRLQFTMESAQQTRAVIDAYAEHFRYGKDTPVPFDDFTRGHMKRGVE